MISDTHTGAVLQAGGKGFTIPNARVSPVTQSAVPRSLCKDDSAVGGVAGGLGSEQPRFAQLGVIDQPQGVTVVIGRSPAERLGREWVLSSTPVSVITAISAAGMA